MSGKGSIRLHPQYGVNPTISQCFYCGQEKGEIALLGAAFKTQAPMHMVCDLRPCEKCLGQWRAKDGVALVEVKEEWPERRGPGRRPSKPQRIPTGRWVVARRSALKYLTTEEIKGHVVLVEMAAWEQIMPKEEA